jgi:hypothetical protein
MKNNQNNSNQKDSKGIKQLLNILGFSDSQADLWLSVTAHDISDDVSPFAFVERAINRYANEKNKKDISLHDGINAMLNDLKQKETAKACPRAYNDATKEPEWPDASNVTFIPSQTVDDVRVFAGDVEITGIVRSTLSYDVEMGIPTLVLEIADPTIGKPKR